MKRKQWEIEENEWYPVYSLHEWTDSPWTKYLLEKTKIRPIEISDADLAFIERAFHDFDKAQELLLKLRGY